MMIRIFFSSIFFIANVSAFAADIPSIDLGADKFDAKECVSMFRDQCINEQCMNSEDTDCQGQCQAGAEDKCEENTEE